MTTPEPRSVKRGWLAATAAAVVVVLVGLVWWLVASGNDDANGGQPSNGATTPAPGEGTSSPAATNPSSPVATPSTLPSVTKAPKPIRTGLDGSVDVRSGVTVTMAKVESVKGTAKLPGEIAGPALRFTIAIKNDTAKPIDLDLALATAYFGADNKPAVQLTGPGGRDMPPVVRRGDTATGVYVFNVPRDQRGQVRLDFSYELKTPVVIFKGAAPA
ncbi:MAG: hypothetical protein QM655_09380 [Nocardioidaceae bacterium]